jgi:hypothetical protein
MWEEGLTCHIADAPITWWQNPEQYANVIAVNLTEKRNAESAVCIKQANNMENVLLMAECIVAVASFIRWICRKILLSLVSILLSVRFYQNAFFRFIMIYRQRSLM